MAARLLCIIGRLGARRRGADGRGREIVAQPPWHRADSGGCDDPAARHLPRVLLLLLLAAGWPRAMSARGNEFCCLTVVSWLGIVEYRSRPGEVRVTERVTQRQPDIGKSSTRILHPWLAACAMDVLCAHKPPRSCTFVHCTLFLTTAVVVLYSWQPARCFRYTQPQRTADHGVPSAEGYPAQPRRQWQESAPRMLLVAPPIRFD